MQHDFILLDRSGSMANRWEEALSSINAYVAKLAEDKVDTGVTLAAFDIDTRGMMSFDILRDRIIPSTWHKVTNRDAEPRGGTPLNDAVGRLVARAKAGNYDKVAIIIMTDGEENSSKELTVEQARNLLDDCRKRGWQVIFLGADFNNVRQATSYGTAAANTVSMGVGNFGNTMATMSTLRAGYAVTGAAMNFTDAEKAKLAKKKS